MTFDDYTFAINMHFKSKFPYEIHSSLHTIPYIACNMMSSNEKPDVLYEIPCILRQRALHYVKNFLSNRTHICEQKNVREYRRSNQKWTTKEKLATIRIKHNPICVGHHYAQTNINNVNKT